MIIVQTAIDDINCPDNAWFVLIAEKILSHLALPDNKKNADLLIKITDVAEVQNLNKTYRKQNKATNILSFAADDLSDFPAELQAQIPILLGELVICFEVVKTEAKLEQKTIKNHLIHLIIHGVLHLLEYDHEQEDEAKIMEDLEDEVLVNFDVYLDRG